MTDYYDPARRSPSISRRPGNRRSDTWIRALLARVQVCRVATLWNTQPFINPTAFVYRPEHHDIVFHSNLAGRVRANVERAGERAEQVCFEASEIGRLLPSNDPLELSMQYRSVIAFGMVSLLEDEAARQGLTDLSARMFPHLRPGAEMRPISADDLARTSVYSLKVSEWSGKENWQEMADQTPDWPALPGELLT
ncbi:pyridoxamine 5'-phosphate oxidase family protein [Deinococcus sp.]|uniref:pyridoxamine 5'-phosphate oxidase family protein n=1 Tax=Deinococcus sp. TaxID=47478 RepID=UPI00286E1C78|nr:pyridoxamine 5'-phosphate oxidase family protein [Deinococcus sp.]